MSWLSPYRSPHQDPQTPVGLSGTTASLAQYVADNIKNEFRSDRQQNCDTFTPKRPIMWKSVMKS